MKYLTTVTPFRFEEKFWILAFDNALVSKFENIDFDRGALADHAARYSVPAFRKSLREHIVKLTQERGLS